MQEEKIISLCQKGQLEEFAKLYDKYISKIYRFVYYKTSHRETAEDLTSQTFIKALNKINSFNQAKGTFQAWLFMIARNTVIDYYRKYKSAVNIEDCWDLGQANDILSKLANRERIAKVRQCLQKLSPKQREVIILRAWENMGYKEIAEIMAMSQSACKMAFIRGIAKIKDNLPMLTALLILIINQY